jgi:hypothetical protein
VTFRLKVAAIGTGQILALHQLTGEVVAASPKTE